MSVSKTFEDRHRERKRKKEMEVILDEIMPFINSHESRKILEFGSGDGYQIPYLKALGSLVASDMYKSEEITKNYPDVEFVTCDITNAHFPMENFDIIFSNHVLEHIKDVKKVFTELKKIGTRGCIYVFTVPTATWLLLSIPAQCYNAVRRLLNREPESKVIKRKRGYGRDFKGLQRFLPAGHGWRRNFFECFNAFKVANWQRLFVKNGFGIIKKAPLLLYAPSEFPIIPTTGFLARLGICSSAMFIMKKV